MEGPITYAQLAVFFAFGTALIGGLVWCATLIGSMKAEFHGRVNRLGEALADYKLQVARECATNEHLRELRSEVRQPIIDLTKEIRELTGLMKRNGNGHAPARSTKP